MPEVHEKTTFLLFNHSKNESCFGRRPSHRPNFSGSCSLGSAVPRRAQPCLCGSGIKNEWGGEKLNGGLDHAPVY